jgi:hypothetical protein
VARAFRYGQRRSVFVYRLITEGFEECLYRQQVVSYNALLSQYYSTLL